MDEPTKDRLHNLAHVAIDAIDEHPDLQEGDRILVLVTSSEGGGGASATGYEHPADVLPDLMNHVTNLCRAAGFDADIKVLLPQLPDDQTLL